MGGLTHIINTCSHLQNASKARLGMTSIPNTRYNLNLSLALHRAGFISSIYRGGPQPPSQEEMSRDPEPVTHANVATRRLWLGLKYWNNEPVLSKLKIVTKPTRPIILPLIELHRVVRGFPSSNGRVDGLNLGECLFVNTDKGVLEAREALDRQVGGLVLCRVR